MAQSLARLHIHLIFSTKRRAPIIGDPIREDLHAYAAVILKNLGCPAAIINSVEDHAHLLVELSRTRTIADVVEEVKKATSKWIKTRGPEFTDFSWQAGYGAFAVSASKCDEVRRYIADQREHHRGRTFQEEFRAFCERHGLALDERYAWD